MDDEFLEKKDPDLRRHIELHKEVEVNGKKIKSGIKRDLLQKISNLTEEDYTVIPSKFLFRHAYFILFFKYEH